MPHLDWMAIGDSFLVSLGGGGCPLDVRKNDLEFVKHYDLTIDGRSFDFQSYKHLIPLYEDDHPFQVMMAGAQTGKTARLLVHLTRQMLVRWGGLFGYYFPDALLPAKFSRDRFKPFLLSNPDLGALLGIPKTSGAEGVDNVYTRSLGESVLFFLTLAGRSSTEGLPLQAVYFDEVRSVKDPGDIVRAKERYSAQKDPIDVMVSTAKFPESDIDLYFRRGDQRWFHTDCRCSDGVVLSQTFPDCIADLRTATPALKRKVEHAYSHAGLPYLGMTERERLQYPEAAFLCPTCGELLVDPRAGWWVPHGSGYTHSWQMPQLLSPTYPAGRVLEKMEHGDLQELWNSCVGVPFIDDTKRPVKPEHLAACVTRDLVWPATKPVEWRRQFVRHVSLGVDVQAGYLVAVFKAYSPNGKHRVVHLEVIHGPHEHDPWHTLGRRMDEWDVRAAVIDQAPEWSAALRFAQVFKGRVWLANYDDKPPGADVVTWGDATNKKSQKGEETKFRHRVNIDRTRGLKWSLGRWAAGANETPPPDELIQVLPRQGGRPKLSPELRAGRRGPVKVCEELLHDHLMRIVFFDEYEGDQQKMLRGKRKQVAEYIGLDPHFAHADLYASVALERIGRPKFRR